MSTDDPRDSDSDPFGPPAISTLVGCLHCGEEYDSYRIEWRIERTVSGQTHGFWCCPIAGCDGKGFGFDILPCDPHYRDENGGWFHDDEDDESEDLADDADDTDLNGEPPTDDPAW